MNKPIIAVVSFLGGATVSYFVCRYFLEKKYDEIAQEGVDQVLDKYKCKCKEYDKLVEAYRKKDDRDVADVIADSNDSDKKEDPKNVKPQENSIDKEPDFIRADYKKISKDYRPSPISIISANEFGENPEYEHVIYTYYKDSVLVDDIGDVVDEGDIDETVGREALRKLESGDDDTVYIQNDTYRMYYEICNSDDSYFDEDGYSS